MGGSNLFRQRFIADMRPSVQEAQRTQFEKNSSAAAVSKQLHDLFVILYPLLLVVNGENPRVLSAAFAKFPSAAQPQPNQVRRPSVLTNQ
jgi:hypothetical protein